MNYYYHIDRPTQQTRNCDPVLGQCRGSVGETDFSVRV